MAASKFTSVNRASIVAAVGAGVGLADAARAADVRVSTVKGWITRGNRGDAGYVDFVADVDSARADFSARPAPMSEDEFQRHLDNAVRAGSVAAMKLWSERSARAKDKPAAKPSKIASLAEHRRKAGAR